MEMNTANGLSAKTALEHLIFLSGKNIIEVCRALNITPQQFSDWIKKRRPVPAQRQKQLAAYFGISEELIADQNRFAKGLSALNAIELELIIVRNKAKLASSETEQSEMAYHEQRLKEEYQKQIRIARLSALLDKDVPATMAKIDAFLTELEKQ
jgi:transcriptional regulator with XRE-family HTH domain